MQTLAQRFELAAEIESNAVDSVDALVQIPIS
jgi:hypothetical protein